MLNYQGVFYFPSQRCWIEKNNNWWRIIWKSDFSGHAWLPKGIWWRKTLLFVILVGETATPWGDLINIQPKMGSFHQDPIDLINQTRIQTTSKCPNWDLALKNWPLTHFLLRFGLKHSWSITVCLHQKLCWTNSKSRSAQCGACGALVARRYEDVHIHVAAAGPAEVLQRLRWRRRWRCAEEGEEAVEGG